MNVNSSNTKVVMSPQIKVITSNDPSLDSSILNSPSSVHRLQTSFRKKVLPTEITQQHQCDLVFGNNQQQQTKSRTVSRASHATNDSGQYSGDEQFLVVMKDSEKTKINNGQLTNNLSEGESEHDRMLMPMRAWHSSAPYRRPTVLDRLRQVALCLLPLVLGAVIVLWALHFRENNTLAAQAENSQDGLNKKTRTFPISFVFKMTVASLVCIGILLCPIIATTQSPYSFVFIPNDREQPPVSVVGKRREASEKRSSVSGQRQPPPSTNDFDSNLSLLHKSLLTRKPKPLANPSKVKTTDSAKRKSLEEIETNVTIYKGHETIQLNTVGVGSPKLGQKEQTTQKVILETSFLPLKTKTKITAPEDVHLDIPQ